MRTCPHCREDVKDGATVCPHCQRQISTVAIVGEGLQAAGCILTLLITVPILLFVLLSSC